MGEITSQAVLLSELEPVAEELLDRHLTTTKPWSPHEYIPYGRGRDFDPAHEWTDADSAIAPLDEATRSNGSSPR